MRIEFEPTAAYLHEVVKFKNKHASTRDKVMSFNEATKFWNADKYLKKVHAMNPPATKDREGRKLNLAEYMKKMQPKPIKKPSATRRKVIPDYVIPSEKKRD